MTAVCDAVLDTLLRTSMLPVLHSQAQLPYGDGERENWQFILLISTGE